MGVSLRSHKEKTETFDRGRKFGDEHMREVMGGRGKRISDRRKSPGQQLSKGNPQPAQMRVIDEFRGGERDGKGKIMTSYLRRRGEKYISRTTRQYRD